VTGTETTAGARGAVAQLGEHLLCKQGVVGSIPISSTTPGNRGQATGNRRRPRTTIDCGTQAALSFVLFRHEA
jgi:hypothetical protein